MKTNLILALLVSILLSPLAGAHGKHGHGHGHDQRGPNNGVVIHDVNPHVELVVTKDRKLQFTFLDGSLKKAVPPKQQSISVVCGKRLAPTRMSFVRQGNSFVSDRPLPAGSPIRTVIRFKMTKNAKVNVVRLNLVP